PARYIKVAGPGRISALHQNERVIVAPRIAAIGSEQLTKAPGLVKASPAKGATWNVNRRAERSRKRKHLRVIQRQLDGSKSSHGDDHNRPAFAVRTRRKTRFHVSGQIMDDIVLVAILAAQSSVGVIGVITPWHHQQEILSRVLGNIGIVGPIPKASAATV